MIRIFKPENKNKIEIGVEKLSPQSIKNSYNFLFNCEFCGAPNNVKNFISRSRCPYCGQVNIIKK